MHTKGEFENSVELEYMRLEYSMRSPVNTLELEVRDCRHLKSKQQNKLIGKNWKNVQQI